MAKACDLSISKLKPNMHRPPRLSCRSNRSTLLPFPGPHPEPADEAAPYIAIAVFIRHIAIIQPRYYEGNWDDGRDRDYEQNCRGACRR